MKIFIAVLCIAAVASAGFVQRTREDLDRARGVCIKKFEVGPERIKEYRERIFRETDKETPFYVECVFETLGLFRNGVFVTDDYLVQLGRGDEWRERVEGCYDVTGTESHIRAFRSFVCFLEKGLLPEGY